MIIRDILKDKKDQRPPFDHFDKMYRTIEFHSEKDVTMTPVNTGLLMVC